MMTMIKEQFEFSTVIAIDTEESEEIWQQWAEAQDHQHRWPFTDFVLADKLIHFYNAIDPRKAFKTASS